MILSTWKVIGLIALGVKFESLSNDGPYFAVNLPEGTTDQIIERRGSGTLEIVIHCLPSGRRVKENRYFYIGKYFFSTLKLIASTSTVPYIWDQAEIDRLVYHRKGN